MKPVYQQMFSGQRAHGFTIVELLIVIVVIGVLAAIVIVAYTGVTAKANDSRRAADLEQIQKALGRYYVDNGSYPLCVDTVQNCLASILVPTYMNTLPNDPKNTGSYIYRYAGGYRKTGATTYTHSSSTNDYILGDKGDTGGTTYSGWGANDLTILLGN